jgi:hypothetical protein
VNGTYKTRHLGHHGKTKPRIMDIEEGKEIQTKGIDNLFNKIIAENFPHLEIKRNSLV